MIPTSADVAFQNMKRGAVRQAGARQRELGQGGVILTQASEEVIGPGEAYFG